MGNIIAPFSSASNLIGHLHMTAGQIRRLLDLPADREWRTTKNISYLSDTAQPFQFSHDDRSFLNSKGSYDLFMATPYTISVALRIID